MEDFKTLVENLVKDVENLESFQQLLAALNNEDSPFIGAVLENAGRITKYKLGGDGSDGGCDCIGLIIGAVRLMGKTWGGIHGSNYAARYKTVNMAKLTSADQLKAGNLVYKTYIKSDSGYNLPSRYSKDADKKDYYHVGVVTSIDPLVITHCTNTAGGIKRDNTIGKWSYFGELML